MNVNEELKEFKETLELARKYYHAIGIIGFDFETIVPEKSREEEGNTLDFLSNEVFKIRNSDRMKYLTASLHDHLDEIEDPLDKRLIELSYDGYLKSKNITPEFDLKMSSIFSKAYSRWLEAKSKKDYSIFKESLKDIVNISKEEIALRENKLDDIYDTLLNDYEKGLIQKDLDPFFNELKEGLIKIINKIKASKHHIREDFLSRSVPIYKQEQFSRYLLELNGYDFSRGVLSTTEHPFTSDVSKDDARVTTHYHENMFLSNIFSIIHEGGHAIFMQNEPDEDYDHYINDEISCGMHESVSRLFENVIGRSKEYIHLIYPKMVEIFKDELSDISEQEIYEAVNIVTPSLIRTEADEVTYGLHIVIRYELEKLIVHNKISLDDVPMMWNKLYKEYLGVDVPDDSQGVLQDVHWSGGFGYFPSYAIGNCYNAMYVKKMKEDIPFDELVLKGDFKTINNYLKEHIFVHANRLDPKDWIKEITNKSLSPRDFLDYLDKKYKEIYKYE